MQNPLAVVTRPLPLKVGAGSSATDVVLGGLTESTGWIVVDAAVGAGVGWFIAPKGQETGYAIGGALATGLTGVLGLAGLLGWRYLVVKEEPSKHVFGEARENPIARDYIAVNHSGRKIAGPFKHYDAAKREADQAGGYVKFAAEERRKRRIPRYVRFYVNGRFRGWKNMKTGRVRRTPPS